MSLFSFHWSPSYIIAVHIQALLQECPVRAQILAAFQILAEPFPGASQVVHPCPYLAVLLVADQTLVASVLAAQIQLARLREQSLADGSLVGRHSQLAMAVVAEEGRKEEEGGVESAVLVDVAVVLIDSCFALAHVKERSLREHSSWRGLSCLLEPEGHSRP